MITGNRLPVKGKRLRRAYGALDRRSVSCYLVTRGRWTANGRKMSSPYSTRLWRLHITWGRPQILFSFSGPTGFNHLPNQSNVNPSPFVIIICVYSTRRMLPSLSVTVPSVLFQSRMVSLPLLKVLSASFES